MTAEREAVFIKELLRGKSPLIKREKKRGFTTYFFVLGKTFFIFFSAQAKLMLTACCVEPSFFAISRSVMPLT